MNSSRSTFTVPWMIDNTPGGIPEGNESAQEPSVCRWQRPAISHHESRPDDNLTFDRKSKGWSAIREQLREWSRPAVMTLIKDLFRASPANRDFLHARFQAEETGGRSPGRRSPSDDRTVFPAARIRQAESAGGALGDPRLSRLGQTLCCPPSFPQNGLRCRRSDLASAWLRTRSRCELRRRRHSGNRSRRPG
jgi:hypothetical protein